MSQQVLEKSDTFPEIQRKNPEIFNPFFNLSDLFYFLNLTDFFSLFNSTIFLNICLFGHPICKTLFFYFQIYGDGSQTRSFQYVSDLVDGLISLMNSNYTNPVNLGNPVEHTIEGKKNREKTPPFVICRQKPLSF